MTIKLKKGLKLKVLKKVKIKDNDYNRPGPGYLNPGTLVEIVSSPTRLSDVPFKVLSGSGEYLSRGIMENVTYPINTGSSGFFFREGHKTNAPYDYGTLDSQFFEVINIDKKILNDENTSPSKN
jgi:hypothetical protein